MCVPAASFLQDALVPYDASIYDVSSPTVECPYESERRSELLSGAEGLARLLGNCCLSMSAVSVPSLGQLACINSVISLAYVFNYVL